MKGTGFFYRFLCLLLIAALLGPAAAADPADLSSLSNDEIVALLEKVNEEVVPFFLFYL